VENEYVRYSQITGAIMTDINTPARRGFAESVNVNPIDFLKGKESIEQADARLTEVVKIVIQNGLTRQDGELCLGLKSDMPKAFAASKSVDGHDANYMRHSNSGLMNAAGRLLMEWGHIHTPLGRYETRERRLTTGLKNTEKALQALYSQGFDTRIQPRQWDKCRTIGHGSVLSRPQCA
jgi:hypothetical protein